MNSDLTLANSSVGVLPDLEVFLRSVPTKVPLNDLPIDTLRTLVYFLSKAGPYQIAVDTGSYTGTLEEWLRDLKSNLSFRDIVNTYSDLAGLASKGLLKLGDLVFVKDTSFAYIYDGASFGPIEDGFPIRGPSNYELAVLEQNFKGSAQDYLNSLKGKDGLNGKDGAKGDIGPKGDKGVKGDTGPEGPVGKEGPKGKDGVNGAAGKDGVNGKSAYQLYTETVEGTPKPLGEWLESLKGADGAKGDEGKQGVRGDKGLSAYEVAVKDGFIGTEKEWIDSLGGKDAYETYLKREDKTEEEFSLEDWYNFLRYSGEPSEMKEETIWISLHTPVEEDFSEEGVLFNTVALPEAIVINTEGNHQLKTSGVKATVKMKGMMAVTTDYTEAMYRDKIIDIVIEDGNVTFYEEGSDGTLESSFIFFKANTLVSFRYVFSQKEEVGDNILSLTLVAKTANLLPPEVNT